MAPSRSSRTKNSNHRVPQPETRLVVYVHGIGKQPDREQLKLEWDLALFGQDRGERTRMAHWADILHSPPASGTKSHRSGNDRSDGKRQGT